MFEFLCGLVVGALVGWTIKQPQWVTDLINKFKNKTNANDDDHFI